MFWALAQDLLQPKKTHKILKISKLCINRFENRKIRLICTVSFFSLNLMMFVERLVSYSQYKQKMTSFRGQATSAKMMLLGGKLTALTYHLTKRLNKAKELTYLSTNIAICPLCPPNRLHIKNSASCLPCLSG
jgi:hypothetical protein